MWRTAAEEIGATFSALPGGVGEINYRGRRLTVRENRTSIDDPANVALAADKLAVHDLLSKAGISVPRQILLDIGDVEKALDCFKDSELGLVVKPAANTGAGAGVSTCVKTPRQLLIASAWARAYGGRILIEEQIAGDCYRVLIMDGEVLDTVLRRPPSVTGDGVCSLRQLLRRENKLRRKLGAFRGQVLIRIDPDLRNTIMRQGFSLASRPREGEVVVLKQVINDNGTLENFTANGSLNALILASAQKAAALVGTRLSGVDIICPDPRRCLNSSRGAVIEVNANPGLYYHYRPGDAGFPITEKVLRRYFEIPDSPLC